MSLGSAGEGHTPEPLQHVECWSPASKLPVRLNACGHLASRASLKTQGRIFKCPICRRADGHLGTGELVPDFVPTEDLLWDVTCTHVRTRQRPRREGGLTFEKLLAQLSAGAWQLDIRWQRLSPRPVPPQTDSFLVWRATPRGCTVQQGTIALPKDGVLLLAGHGAHFNQITFSGGALVCAGGDFSGSFTACVFQQTALFAVHGARVRLRHCVFHSSRSAIVASSSRTAVHVTDTCFSRCKSGVNADRGAYVVLQAAAFLGNISPLIVNDSGSHIEVERAVVQPESGQSTLCAAMADRGGSMRMSNCQLSGAGMAIGVSGRSSVLQMRDSAICGAYRAVVVDDLARAAMHAVDISPSGRTPEAEIAGRACMVCVGDLSEAHKNLGGSLQIHRCALRADFGQGIHVFGNGRVDARQCSAASPGLVVNVGPHGGRAVLQFCRASSPGGVCSIQEAPGVLRLISCEVESASGICAASYRGTLVAVDSDFQASVPGAFMTGALSVGAGKAVFLRSRVRGGETAVLGNECEVKVIDCDLVGVQPGTAGASAGDGSPHSKCAMHLSSCKLDMRGGTVQGFPYGVTCGPGAPQTVLSARLHAVRFDGCAQAVLFGSGISGRVHKCHFTGCDAAWARRVTRHSEYFSIDNAQVDGAIMFPFPGGVMFANADGGTVADCTFEGLSLSVDVGGVRLVRVVRCLFQAAPDADAPSVRVGSEAVVEDCRFNAGKWGVVVQPGLPCSPQSIRGCSFADCASGVSVEQGAAAALHNCDFLRLQKGLTVAADCGVSLHDCACVDTGTAVSAKGGRSVLSVKRLTVRGGFWGVIAMGAHGAPSEVEVVDCKFTGTATGAVVALMGVGMSVLRCKVEGASWGVIAQGSSMLRLRSSSIRGCASGITLGDRYVDLVAGCRHCQRSGDQGYAQALQAVLSAQRGGLSGGSCAHEGGLARAVVESVCVADCEDVGVQVNTSGHIVATRMHVAGCGIQVTRVAEQSRFVDCSLEKGCYLAFVRERVPWGPYAREPEEVPGVAVVPASVAASHAEREVCDL